LVLVFTDGITEAMRGEEFYGDERVERLVTNVRGNSPEEIARSLLDDIKRFVKDSPRSDDITMLLIKKDRPC
jgi:sigma-B regulation protein RsbU (phosphoserine phosphatase)